MRMVTQIILLNTESEEEQEAYVLPQTKRVSLQSLEIKKKTVNAIAKKEVKN